MTSRGSPLRVLFVGNSLTYFAPGAGPAEHDLPGALGAMTGAVRGLAAERIVRDGACLREHIEGTVLDRALRPGRWDWVTLQESRERAAADPAGTREDLRRLDERVRAVGARTALFSPWGDAPLEAFHERLALELSLRLVPVGRAWRLALGERPGLTLLREDGLHAAPLGTYLCACVFYACLWGEPPAAETEERAFLRRMALEAVRSLPATAA